MICNFVCLPSVWEDCRDVSQSARGPRCFGGAGAPPRPPQWGGGGPPQVPAPLKGALNEAQEVNNFKNRINNL